MELDEAHDLARTLLEAHGLTGWRVRFDTAKRRAGVCRYGERVLGLSGPLTRLHSQAEVRDTILHEIAHALVGAEHGHDEVWRTMAQAIGCSGERCVPAEAPRVAGAWCGVCPAGHRKERHKRPERVLSCSRCYPSFALQHLFTWTHRGRSAPMHPNYVAELEALRAGRQVPAYAVGSWVQVVAAGAFDGRAGRVVGRGRTSYHVQLPEGILRVPFAAVISL